jgi:hypothetical protein
VRELDYIIIVNYLLVMKNFFETRGYPKNEKYMSGSASSWIHASIYQ